MGKRAAAPTGGRRRKGGGGRRRGGTRRAARRSAVPRVLLALGLVTLCLGGAAAVAQWRDGGTDEPTAAGRPGNAGSTLAPPAGTPLEEPAPPSASPDRSAAASPRASRSASPRAPEPGKARPPEQQPPAAVPSSVPSSGAGTFTTARTGGDKVGTGPLRRYRVQVEDGIDGVGGLEISAAQAAQEIEGILAHPRGWAAHGRGSFQLVTEDADFVIRIATPDTADALCGAQGLDTGGELNCETVDGVVVNLKRWMLGSPTFAGTPAEYRHLIINHEIGHEIGIRQHMGCPGPGQPAPVMMQQIKGLDGCVSNAWPYAEDGRYLTGPIV
ncbi:DUF3152 domain-containing protein [Streptomyces sp. NPDC003036]|uniref:DUF3152 domain-containing protein n=1 Tax=Streptomyces sp. NPDC003036 TaxID=3154442 RepID=UPI0033B81BD1